jgi:hypothetical protein
MAYADYLPGDADSDDDGYLDTQEEAIKAKLELIKILKLSSLLIVPLLAKQLGIGIAKKGGNSLNFSASQAIRRLLENSQKSSAFKSVHCHHQIKIFSLLYFV